MTGPGLTTTDALRTADCVSYRLRRAARKAAIFYDAALRPAGLRNTQFTLLGVLDSLGETSIGDLSEELAIDGTTLTRNLDILVRRALVSNAEADDGRVRNVRLTESGKATFENALPLWRRAQQHVLEVIEPERWTGLRSDLGKIEVACDGGG